MKRSIDITSSFETVKHIAQLKSAASKEEAAARQSFENTMLAVDLCQRKLNAQWTKYLNHLLSDDGYVDSLNVCLFSDRIVILGTAFSYKRGKYPVFRIQFEFGFKNDDELNYQIATLQGVLITSSRGQS